LPGDSNWIAHKLIIGQEDRILICQAILPHSDLKQGVGSKGDLKVQEDGEWTSRRPDDYPFSLLGALPHAGHAERVRSMPQHGTFVASKSCGKLGSSAVHVFDISSTLVASSHEKEAGSPSQDLPDADTQASGPLLSSNPGDPSPAGRGLCWSSSDKGLLLCTCAGGIVSMYRVDDFASAGSHSNGEMRAISVFSGHGGKPVHDVAFAGESDIMREWHNASMPLSVS
jgi:hypothetical protein